MIGRGSLEGGNGSINDRGQQLTDFMRPKFPPSARLDFQVTGYVPPGEKLVDEICVVGPRKEQSLKALGVATRAAKFTSLTAITRRRELVPGTMVLGLFFRGVGRGDRAPLSALLGLAVLSRSSLWGVAPTVLPMQYNPIRSNARNDTTACQKQTNSDRPSTTAHWPLATAHRITTPS